MSTAVFLVAAILYFIAPMSILRHIVQQPDVDQETVLGAIAAYLMVGMSFAFSYRALGALRPARSSGPGSTARCPGAVLLLHHLTTTGYGNLVPAANPGQTFAVLEMLIGQLFLVTAVAKVVNMWRPGRLATRVRQAARPASRRLQVTEAEDQRQGESGEHDGETDQSDPHVPGS